jgi:hypothetical protein
MARSTRGASSKKVTTRLGEIVALTDAVCREHLNEEYAELARRLAADLWRDYPDLVGRGQAKTWACGIVYTIGMVNFLFDKTQSPHMTTDQLCAAFSVGKSTASAKSSEIRDAYRMMQLDPRWTLPSRAEDNPLIWMLSVNGVVVDIRWAPREAQEEALRLGLIPYIPEPKPGT